MSEKIKNFINENNLDENEKKILENNNFLNSQNYISSEKQKKIIIDFIFGSKIDTKYSWLIVFVLLFVIIGGGIFLTFLSESKYNDNIFYFGMPFIYFFIIFLYVFIKTIFTNKYYDKYFIFKKKPFYFSGYFDRRYLSFKSKNYRSEIDKIEKIRKEFIKKNFLYYKKNNKIK